MAAFASGDICFSREQSDQSTLLFEELKRSKKVKVKAESIKEEPELEASSGAQDRGSADETKDVELVLSFTSEAQMIFASEYATRVHHASASRRSSEPFVLTSRTLRTPMAFILTSCSTWPMTPMLSSSSPA